MQTPNRPRITRTIAVPLLVGGFALGIIAVRGAMRCPPGRASKGDLSERDVAQIRRALVAMMRGSEDDVLARAAEDANSAATIGVGDILRVAGWYVDTQTRKATLQLASKRLLLTYRARLVRSYWGKWRAELVSVQKVHFVDEEGRW